MHIAVSSNCQTEGIANTLKALFPEAGFSVFYLPWPIDKQEHVGLIAKNLASADVWVTIAPQSFVDQVLAVIGKQPLKVIWIPAIGFSAFHPDQCYAEDQSTKQLTQHHYNSAIVAWSYKNRVTGENAVSLFNSETYRRLGYYDMWAAAVSHLKQSFIARKLEDEYNTFWWHIRRSGIFMHSINHPKISVLVRLAKIVAVRLGKPLSIMDSHIDIHDNLDTTVWPVYPEIAEHLGLPGYGHSWKISPTQYLNSPASYVEHCFAEYARQGIAPENLKVLHRDEQAMHAALAEQLKVT